MREGPWGLLYCFPKAGGLHTQQQSPAMWEKAPGASPWRGAPCEASDRVRGGVLPRGAPCLRARSSRPGQMGSSATPGIPPHPVKSKDSLGWSFFRHTTPSLGRTGTESKSRTDPVSVSQPQPAPEGWGRGGDSCSRELQPPRSRGGPQPSLAQWAGAGARPCRRARPLWAPPAPSHSPGRQAQRLLSERLLSPGAPPCCPQGACHQSWPG